MHHFCLPVLYYSVDISYHNDNREWPILYPGTKVTSDNPERLSDAEDLKLYRRQQVFVSTVNANPVYGSHVHRFAWTYGSWGFPDNRLNETSTWKAFNSLKHVKSLDFCSTAIVRELNSPPPLFHSATEIRLSGQMSQTMVSSLLHSSDLSKLTFLELNNLQDFGQIRKGKCLPLTSEVETPRETRYRDQKPKNRHPGPMRDHLYYIQGRCTALKHLALRSVGQDYKLDWFEGFGSDVHDEERYTEWANFIDSVKHTLRVLELEQGLPPDKLGPPGCRRGCRELLQRDGRPMDVRFMKYIMPTLLRGPWPHLENMTIKGLGGRVQREFSLDCMGHDMQEEIDKTRLKLVSALPSSAKLHFEHEAGRTFYSRINGVIHH